MRKSINPQPSKQNKKHSDKLKQDVIYRDLFLYKIVIHHIKGKAIDASNPGLMSIYMVHKVILLCVTLKLSILLQDGKRSCGRLEKAFTSERTTFNGSEMLAK